MPSSWSPSLRFELQFTGENINLWGEKLNAALSRADYAIAGFTTIPLVTSPYALTTANGSADEARSAMLKFTGTSAFTVTIPAVSKTYVVWNACSGIVTLTTGAGATVAIDPGDIVIVLCDGTNVKTLGYGGYSIKDYIAAQLLASSTALPGQLGNSSKWLKTDGTNATWQALSATATQVRTGTATDLALTPGDTYSALAEVTLTSTSNSVAVNMGSFINGYHRLTENTIFADPTNAKPGQSGVIRIEQHATSAKTCAFASNWKRQGGALAIGTTLGGFTFVTYQVITSSYILYDLIREPS